jgi:uncharacterized membrane protein YdbT with pleckstrin-like domain
MRPSVNLTKGLVMKTLLLASLALFTAVSCTHKQKMEHDMSSLSFEEAKELKLEMIKKKSAMLDSEKSCVESAKNKDDIMMCMEKMHDKKKAMKKEMKEKIKKHS